MAQQWMGYRSSEVHFLLESRPKTLAPPRVKLLPLDDHFRYHHL
jgi:hypothetical protein